MRAKAACRPTGSDDSEQEDVDAVISSEGAIAFGEKKRLKKRNLRAAIPVADFQWVEVFGRGGGGGGIGIQGKVCIRLCHRCWP